jgi:negative regulator of flagellin synthesis FlgM
MASFDIGATPPVGAVQLTSVQPTAASVAAAATTSTAAPVSGAAISTAAPEVRTSLSVSAGEAPVDRNRVDEIRKAVQSGTYPLVPAKIGDAMVAAGLMLRKVG